MGNLQPLLIRNPKDLTGKEAQACHTRGLIAGFKEQLQAKADSQERDSLIRHIIDDLIKAIASKLTHSITEGTHSGQDHLVTV